MKKLLPIALLFANINTFAQQNTEDIFKIQFKNAEQTIKMICLKNCNYSEIVVKTIELNYPKYFNQNGETTMDDENSDYLFSIQKIEGDKYLLKGLKNTEWNEYTFKTKGFWNNFLIDDKSLKSL